MSIINSTLNLFYIPNLPEENFALDKNDADETLVSILENIDSDSLSIRNFQLQRIQLDNIFVIAADEITAIRLADDSDDKTYNYNYAVLEQVLPLDDETTETQELPYKVIKVIWNGTESVKIICRFDVATFFHNRATFTNESLIERAHIDRFEGESNGYLIPRIDYHEEPIDETPKYLNNVASINTVLSGTVDDYNWNIIYYSDPNYNNAIRKFIVPDETVASITARVEIAGSIEILGDTYYIFRKLDNPNTTFTYNSTTYNFDNTYTYEEIHIYNDGGTIRFELYGFSPNDEGNNWKSLTSYTMQSDTSAMETTVYFDTDVVYYTNPSLILSRGGSFFPILPTSKNDVSLSTTSTSVSITGLADIPLTNPRIIKIISCPLCPASFTDSSCVWKTISDDYMTSIHVIEYIGNEFDLLQKYTYSFIPSIAAPVSYDLQTHSSKYETKLYHSNFTEYDFEYGAYKYTIHPENFEYTSNELDLEIVVSYKQAMLKSDLLFKFYPNNSANSDLPSDEYNLASRYLISDIDNEKPIFTSDYINYIKTGYNYDKANMNRQTVVSSLLAGTSILGGAAGIAAGAATGGISAAAGIGLITSGISSAINIINNRIASEASIQRKLTSYKNSSTGIAGVNALDLRNEYNSLYLMKSEYTMSSEMQNYIYNFFRYYGYQLNILDDVSNYLSSRRYYNYIKVAKVVFDSTTLAKYRKHQELLNEYSKILNEGLTIYHCINKTSFDFDKEYENFETSLT